MSDYRTVVVEGTAGRMGLPVATVDRAAALVVSGEYVRAEGLLSTALREVGSCEPFADARSVVNGLMMELA